MVTIRMSRGGAKKRPFYRVVVVDSRKRRDGSCLDNLGFYSPTASLTDPFRFRLDKNALDSWVQKGAQMSPAVAKLLKQVQHSSSEAVSQSDAKVF